ncbi:MAG: ribosome small subunit-dependent GTPase A [Betaproteobacteria bacterium]|nr:ribosome small subunit-dependent GTPase A [Betaproteobacteria bacterium]
MPFDAQTPGVLGADLAGRALVSAAAGRRTQGLVVAAFGRHFEVDIGHGERLACVARGKKGGIACGDHVALRATGAGQAVIEGILPRRTVLLRADAYRTKLLAANVTQAVVVVAAQPTFYPDLLDRCLIAAEAASIRTLIVLNKCDLEDLTQHAERSLSLYERLGYDLLRLSAHQSIAALRPRLQGHTSILVGQSGMGKSSILNALLPGAGAAIGEISEALDTGRHTTTATRLHSLGPESHLIDSPGLQEFGLSTLEPEAIARSFPEFRAHLGGCRFRNCAHRSEPGCAVLEAARVGTIDPRRLASYHRIIESLAPLRHSARGTHR